MIQCRIAEHLNLATVVQGIGHARRKKPVTAVGVVFVNEMHILPKDMTGAAKEFAFARLLVTKDTQEVIQDDLSTMYNGNMQVRKERDLSPFHKVDLPLLWLINTTGCCRQLILAYFADKFAFAKLPNNISYYDNCHYSQVITDASELCNKVSLWELHNVTAIHSIQYQETKELIYTQKSKAVEKEFQLQLLKEKEKLASQRENSTDV